VPVAGGPPNHLVDAGLRGGASGGMPAGVGYPHAGGATNGASASDYPTAAYTSTAGQPARRPEENSELPIFKAIEAVWFRTRGPGGAGGPQTFSNSGTFGPIGATGDSAAMHQPTVEAPAWRPHTPVQPPSEPLPRRPVTLPPSESIVESTGVQGWRSAEEDPSSSQSWQTTAPEEPAASQSWRTAETAATQTPATQTPATQTPAAQIPSDSAGAEPSGSHGWRTAADDGWKAATAAAEPANAGTTRSGLPKRVPQAQLVPGAVQTPEPTTTTRSRRSPDDVRGLLSAYHRGVQRGRSGNDHK
jgi:hypothetical protein